jgi:hypothetical protein
MNARTRTTSILVTSILAAASVSVVLLWEVSGFLNLRGLNSSADQLTGYFAWAVSCVVLGVLGYVLGRAWRSRVAFISLAVPAVLAAGIPILGVAFILLFQYPIWWPKWLDSEFIGVVAALSGGVLGVSLLPFAGDKPRSGWSLLCAVLLPAWGALVVAGGTWSVLFLE